MSKYRRTLDLLACWFERQKRVLPWRDDPSLYRVWISEIMLQQTQVATVVPYFERFLTRFPSVSDLASAPLEDVLLHWAGLGYYSRARNIHKSAQLIMSCGGFPQTREGWLAMPGVGGYTSGAILSIALDQVEAILDGNVERVLSRVRRIDRNRGDAIFKARLWRVSGLFVKHAHEQGIQPSVLNQALMELGATVCTPRKPKCAECPLAENCRALIAGIQESYPPKKKKKQWINVREELHCILAPDGKVLLRQRQKGEWRSGLWDFQDDAPVGGEEVGRVETRHVVTRHKISRTTYIWRVPEWRAAESALALGSHGSKWIDPEKPNVPVGSALVRTMKEVRAFFETAPSTGIQRSLWP